MSHIVTIATRLYDAPTIAAACVRQGLPAPILGTVQLYSGAATGWQVSLPGWLYPAIIDTRSGEVRFDNYEGKWGDPVHLDRFLQAYAVERAKLEARRRGMPVHEQTLPDGSIRLEIRESA